MPIRELTTANTRRRPTSVLVRSAVIPLRGRRRRQWWRSLSCLSDSCEFPERGVSSALITRKPDQQADHTFRNRLQVIFRARIVRKTWLRLVPMLLESTLVVIGEVSLIDQDAMADDDHASLDWLPVNFRVADQWRKLTSHRSAVVATTKRPSHHSSLPAHYNLPTQLPRVKVPADRLRAMLGTASIAFRQGEQRLAIIDARCRAECQ